MDVAGVVDPAERRLGCGTAGAARSGLYIPGGRPAPGPSSVVVVCVGGAQARTGSQAAEGGGWRPRSPSRLVVVSFAGPNSRQGGVEDARDATAAVPF